MRADALSSALARLRELPVRVEEACYAWSFVDLGWPRPHGHLVLRGGGCEGQGELVAFDEATHRHLEEVALAGELRVAEAPGEGFARCAWEAALLDLGLRQAGHSMSSFLGLPASRRLRVCHSFGQLPAQDAGRALKIDHQEGVDYTGRAVVVVDFKGRELPLEEPDPAWILEDPPAVVRAPWALDQGLLSPADLERRPRPTHLNLKAGRLGGFLRTLEVAVRARELGLSLYWGGQWELGAARRQAQQFAAWLCPEGWNDLAPGPGGYPLVDPRTVQVPLDGPGFGAP